MSHAADLKPGTIIQGYRVVRSIGQGGFGAVYEMVHSQFGRRAALKVLSVPGARPEITVRFLNEARAANAVHHPGIVQIFEIGQLPSGAPWLMMEFIEGETLEERILAVHRGNAPLRHDPVAILYQLADVLCVLHDRGVIHRDLKPANIKLMPDPSRPEGELTKLLDFGIAKFVSESLLEPKDEGPAPPHTRAGVIMGTPSYMAPEQCVSSATVTAKADVYAMGVIAYELFAGRKPYVADPPAIYTLKLTQDAPPLEVVPLQFELKTLIMAMLHRDPAQRPNMFQVMELLAKLGGRGASGAQLRALRSTSTGEQAQRATSPVRRIAWFVGGGSLVGTAIATGFLLASSRSDLGRNQPPDASHLNQLASNADLQQVPPDAPLSDVSSDLAELPDDTSAASQPADTVAPEPKPKPDLLPPPPRDLGVPQSAQTATCAAQIPRAACFRGTGLTDEQRESLRAAAANVGLKLCADQSILLRRELSSFLTCVQRSPTVSQRLCESFVHAADALWKWNPPDQVEIKCPSR